MNPEDSLDRDYAITFKSGATIIFRSGVPYDDWLLRWTRHCIASGHMSREEARRGLVALRDAYSERGLTEEREIIADVLDAIDGWASMKAQI